MRPTRASITQAILCALAVLGLTSAAGCRSASRTAPAVPTTTAAVVPKPPVSPATSKPEQTANSVPPLPVKDTVVVINPGGNSPEKTPTTLLEASEAERKRREERSKEGARPVVITDANLKKFATGDLTTAKPSYPKDKGKKAAIESTDGSEKAAANAGPPDADAPGAEKYWRNRVLEIRRRWHDAVAQEGTLQGKVAKLRREFYAEDDPYYRDSQIKPAWDKALADLEAARKVAKDAQTELATALEQGRKAGAPAGWLRAGIDLQPPPAPKPDHEPKPAPQPGEPQVVEPNGGPPAS